MPCVRAGLFQGGPHQGLGLLSGVALSALPLVQTQLAQVVQLLYSKHDTAECRDLIQSPSL